MLAFSSLIACLEHGQFDADVSAALRGVLAAMRQEHRERGKHPTGKITVAVQFAWEDGTIKTQQSFSADPSLTRAPDRFFVTPDGALSQKPPQERLGLAAIEIKGSVR